MVFVGRSFANGGIQPPRHGILLFSLFRSLFFRCFALFSPRGHTARSNSLRTGFLHRIHNGPAQPVTPLARLSLLARTARCAVFALCRDWATDCSAVFAPRSRQSRTALHGACFRAAPPVAPPHSPLANERRCHPHAFRSFVRFGRGTHTPEHAVAPHSLQSRNPPTMPRTHYQGVPLPIPSHRDPFAAPSDTSTRTSCAPGHTHSGFMCSQASRCAPKPDARWFPLATCQGCAASGPLARGILSQRPGFFFRRRVNGTIPPSPASAHRPHSLPVHNKPGVRRTEKSIPSLRK